MKNSKFGLLEMYGNSTMLLDFNKIAKSDISTEDIMAYRVKYLYDKRECNGPNVTADTLA